MDFEWGWLVLVACASIALVASYVSYAVAHPQQRIPVVHGLPGESVRGRVLRGVSVFCVTFGALMFAGSSDVRWVGVATLLIAYLPAGVAIFVANRLARARGSISPDQD